MEVYFDNLQGLNSETSKFDTFTYSRIEECFNKFDDDLLTQSQNLAWKQFVEYFESNGTALDSLGDEDRWHCDKAGWKESIVDKSYDFGDV